MNSLARLVSLWNSNTQLSSATLLTQSLEEYYQRLAMGNPSSSPLRMSNMGKPLIELVYALKYNKQDTASRADLFRASVGVWCEALLISLAKDANLNITNWQDEVSLNFPGYFTLIGHIDGIADGSTVFDVKCVSASYFNSFSNKLDDDRGYITQLALYQVSTKKPKAAFLLVNSGNGYAKLVPVPQRRLNDALADVRSKLKVLFTNDINTLAATLKPPSKVPNNLKFSKYLKEMYE